MSDSKEMTREQVERWIQAQKGEVNFWQDWMATNIDLGDTQWLLYVLNYFGIPDHHDFGAETLVDLGSGPIGVLTRFKADQRVAVDPIPLESLDKGINRVKMPAEKTGLPAEMADRVFIYNLLQHVISPQHVLDECLRIMKPNGMAYILEQLNLPTDNEHPHSLKLEMFDQWAAKSGLEIVKRVIEQDAMFDVPNTARPGSGYNILCLIVKKPAKY